MEFHLTFHGKDCCCFPCWGPILFPAVCTSGENETWNLFKWTLVYFFKRCICTLAKTSHQILCLKEWIRVVGNCTQLETIQIYEKHVDDDIFQAIASDTAKLISYMFPGKICIRLPKTRHMEKIDWDLLECKWDVEPKLSCYQGKDVSSIKRWRFTKYKKVPIVLHLRDWKHLKIFPFELDYILQNRIKKPEILWHLLCYFPKEVVNLIFIFVNYKICKIDQKKLC